MTEPNYSGERSPNAEDVAQYLQHSRATRRRYVAFVVGSALLAVASFGALMYSISNLNNNIRQQTRRVAEALAPGELEKKADAPFNDLTHSESE